MPADDNSDYIDESGEEISGEDFSDSDEVNSDDNADDMGDNAGNDAGVDNNFAVGEAVSFKTEDMV